MRQYKSEQQAQLRAQEAEIEAERMEARKMKEELERLRAQVKNDETDEKVEERGDFTFQVHNINEDKTEQ